jgi:16S rRNA (uracil1498-N3)-methyltransferase
MRAVVLDQDFNEDDIGKDLTLVGDSARHLIKVIRIKKNEKILLINNLGHKCEVQIKSIDRRTLVLTLLTITEAEDNRQLSLFLGLPKKEAFESIVKMASEIGIKNLYLYRSEYSQKSIEVGDRVERLEESARAQSNNPFKINFITIDSFEEAFRNFSNIFHFSTFSESSILPSKLTGESLLIIGPEAGFSEKEEEQINSFENVSVIKLATNIMRAPTAFAVASGYILKSF